MILFPLLLLLLILLVILIILKTHAPLYTKLRVKGKKKNNE